MLRVSWCGAMRGGGLRDGRPRRRMLVALELVIGEPAAIRSVAVVLRVVRVMVVAHVLENDVAVVHRRDLALTRLLRQAAKRAILVGGLGVDGQVTPG